MAPTEGEYTTWRGDNPGFQTQAVGNYPDKSDAADKDNIYLSDQGWAYRHFTSPDKSQYWDELLWAGYVTVPPGLNDPVGVFGAEEQTFLFGDGFQFVTGNYPLTVSTIGTVTIVTADIIAIVPSQIAFRREQHTTIHSISKSLQWQDPFETVVCRRCLARVRVLF